MKQIDKSRTLSAEEVAAVDKTLLNAENEAVRTAIQLEQAESNTDTMGRAFGQAMRELRNVTKAKGRDYMETLQRLQISYHKAYYWINVVEGKPNNRHRRYWDDSEFCVTQNSDAATSSADDPANPESADKGANPNEGSSRSGCSRNDDICEVKLLLTAQQREHFAAAVKKLIGFAGSKNKHEAVYQVVVQKAAELDGGNAAEQGTLLDTLESAAQPGKRPACLEGDATILDPGTVLGLITQEPAGAEVAQ